MTSVQQHAQRHPTLLVARELALPLESSLVVMGLVTLVLGVPSIAVWTLFVWLLAALAYTVIAVRRLYRASRDPGANRIEFSVSTRQNRVWSHRIHVDVGMIAFSSLMGVVGAIAVLRDAEASSFSGVSRIVAALSIVSAWVLLQFGFSRLYTDSYFRNGGLEFPGTSEPGLIEFAYFTFSIGATFQTSDTNVTSTHMRWLATIHAVLCFFYNMAVLAFAVSLLM